MRQGEGPVEALWTGEVPASHTSPSLAKDLLLKGTQEILLGITPEATTPFLSSLEVTFV